VGKNANSYTIKLSDGKRSSLRNFFEFSIEFIAGCDRYGSNMSCRVGWGILNWRQREFIPNAQNSIHLDSGSGDNLKVATIESYGIMNTVVLVPVFFISLSLFPTIPGFGADDSGPPDFPDVLVVSGTITNDQGKPLKPLFGMAPGGGNVEGIVSTRVFSRAFYDDR
jgi:hypothetical protein